MNIITDFDLPSAVKDVNEIYTIRKVIRNNKKNFFMIQLPTLAILDYALYRENFLKALSFGILTILTLSLGFNAIIYMGLGDIFKDKSDQNLKKLIKKLEAINVNTTFDLVKDAKCYSKIYNLRLSNSKIPQIFESKFILLPSYNYKGEIVDTSLLQEHVVGSNSYVLSVGSPQKVLKAATSRI